VASKSWNLKRALLSYETVASKSSHLGLRQCYDGGRWKRLELNDDKCAFVGTAWRLGIRTNEVDTLSVCQSESRERRPGGHSYLPAGLVIEMLIGRMKWTHFRARIYTYSERRRRRRRCRSSRLYRHRHASVASQPWQSVSRCDMTPD